MDPAKGLWARLTYVPQKVDRLDVTGRTLAWLLLLVFTVQFLRLDYRGPAIVNSVLHHADLVFHEAGHILFIPLGRFMTILGGSLFQCLWPLLLLGFFLLRYQNPFGAAVCLWWCGQNLVDLAPYIADARIMDMPLVGESSDEDADLRSERHDWHNILRILGLLHRDLTLARMAYWLGMALMILGLVWGAYLLYQQRRHIAEGYFSTR